MSKIICDVCGTSYPESVSQCPICGCVRSVDSRVVSSGDETEARPVANGTYTHVKGGRFSKSNVKKRQKGRAQNPVDTDEDRQDVEEKKADKGLLVAFIVLLISVAAVICYILVKFLSPELLNPNADKKPVVGGGNDPVTSTEQDETDLSCQGITFEQQSATLSQVGETFQIKADLTPADTTDPVSYASSDEAVATVTDDGIVTAVGNGEATITVVCGEIQETFTVTCSIQTEDPTIPTVPDVDLPVVPAGFTLKKEDITFAKKGQSYNLYDGNPDIKNQITWKSSDPTVATVSGGKVVAVSYGRTTVTAEYQGMKLTCIVRCKESVGDYVDPETEQSQYKLNKTDVTISVGESFDLYLLNGSDRVSVTFTSSASGICTVSGNSVTGVSSGDAEVSVTYEGVTYSCTVRVK